MCNVLKKQKHNNIYEILKNRKINEDKTLLYYYNMLCSEWDNITYFSLAKKINSSKMDRWSINSDELINLNIEGEKDFYCSVNTFYAPGKQTGKYAKTLNAVILDLDYYTIPYLKDLEPNKVYELLKKDIDFPEISFYTESGRGMCLFWLLEKTYSTQKSRNFYKKIVETMITRFKDFGADPKCKDVARVVRVPGTINSKNGNKVKIVIPNEYYTDLEEYSIAPIRYELYDLAEFFWGVKEVIKTKATKKPKKATKKVCKVTKLKNIYSLYCARTKDLEKIVELRMDKPMEGHREQLLFLYRLNLLFSGIEPQKALELTLSLNSKMYDPLDRKEVEKATQSASDNAETYFRLKDKYKKEYGSINTYLSNGGVYLYSNKTIIELLQITNEEMEHLKNLINKEVKIKNKRVKNQEYYKENQEKENNRKKEYYHVKLKEQGKLTKQEQLNEIYAKIKSLRAKGCKNKDISQELNLTIKTLERYITYMKKNGLL